jgi:uncharacterized membrane protein
MDFLIFPILIGAGGWLLGLIGFFVALSALGQVHELRRIVAAQATQAAARPAASVPFHAPAPSPVDMPADAATVPPETIPPPLPGLPAPEPPAAEPSGPSGPGAIPVRPGKRRDIEAMLTLRWGVWLGAAALLMAGVFLVRYAADQGLLGPATRCVVAALLGLALLAGAEWLRRRPTRVVAGNLAADQAPPALAAGGVGVLFGAAYALGPFYGLVPAPVAFVLLAAAAFAGLAASLRFGQLVAAIGLVGAFATPLLVQSETPSLLGLFAYLLVVIAAALAVVRYRAWVWLGWATTVAAALWAALAAYSVTAADAWAPGLFVPAAAALNLLLLPGAALEVPAGRRLAWVPFAALGAAGLLLESVVPGAAAGLAVPTIGLLLLSPLAVAKGAFEPRLDRLPWLASLFGVLALLAWALPDWAPTGEAIKSEGMIIAVLPGSWAPQLIQPLLWTAAVLAAFHAAAGLWLERRAPHPLHWAALVAGVPVVVLAVTYVQVANFQPDIAWAAAALALTACLTGTATLAAREGDRPRAGVHAAGAVAALALGCAILLSDQWLTLAVALMLPALAWIADRAGLPALRHVALAAAALVLVRLLLNWYVIDYAFGTAPVLNGLWLAYGVPAAAFALAARWFRRGADDRLVAVLEAGAVLFASVLIALEIRHWQTGGTLRDPGSFDELALHTGALALQAGANLWLARRTGRVVLGWAWRLQGTLALLLGTALIIGNPAFLDLDTDALGLAAAYLLPAVIAAACWRPAALPKAQAGILGGYALAAGFVWIGLSVRLLFHPQAMGLDRSPVLPAELWAWSGAWLAYGAALMAAGIRAGRRPLRLAALAIIALVAAKVFLIDMAGLAGLWRVLSFLGLGLALIGLGAVYRRFVVVVAE